MTNPLNNYQRPGRTELPKERVNARTIQLEHMPYTPNSFFNAVCQIVELTEGGKRKYSKVEQVEIIHEMLVQTTGIIDSHRLIQYLVSEWGISEVAIERFVYSNIGSKAANQY